MLRVRDLDAAERPDDDAVQRAYDEEMKREADLGFARQKAELRRSKARYTR